MISPLPHTAPLPSNSQLGPDSLGRVSTRLSPSRRKRGLGSHEEGKMEQMGCRENKGVIKFSSDRKSNRDITSDRPTGILIISSILERALDPPQDAGHKG